MPTKSLTTTISANSHSDSRRRVLKFAIGAASYCVAPYALGGSPASVGNSSRKCAGDRHTAPKPNARDAGIEFRFVDSKSIAGMISLGQGTIVNHTDDEILINSIAPQTLTTDNGSYDIAAYLTEHPVRLASGQRHHFWVRPQSIEPVYSQKITMHGSLDLANVHREPVMAHIDNPGIGVAAKVEPVELMVATASS